MKITRKYFAIMLSLLICISSVCVPVMAEEVSNVAETVETEASINSTSYSFSQGGYLSNDWIQYTLNIPASQSYSVTISVNGSLWVVLEKSGGSPRPINTTLTGSYQNHLYLTSGTYYLLLQGTGSYGIVIFND